MFLSNEEMNKFELNQLIWKTLHTEAANRVLYTKSCFKKFCRLHRKTPVSECLF